MRVLHCSGMNAECVALSIMVRASAALLFICGNKNESGTIELSELQFCFALSHECVSSCQSKIHFLHLPPSEFLCQDP